MLCSSAERPNCCDGGTGRLRLVGRERSRQQLALKSQGRMVLSRTPSRISCLRSGPISDYNRVAP